MAPGLCGLLLMVIWRSKSSVVLCSISHADIVVFSLVGFILSLLICTMTPGDNFSSHHALLLLGKLQFGSGMTIYRFWDMLQETCTVVVDSFFSALFAHILVTAKQLPIRKGRYWSMGE